MRELAWETGFQRRAHRKIDPVVFAQMLHDQSLKETCSYNDLAVRIDEHSGGLVSRQAVGKRMDESCFRFIEALLARAMMKPSTDAETVSRGHHNRVLVQDSTVVALPQRLFHTFSGVSNGHSKVCNARIQAVCDLAAGRFVSFSLDPYSKNDHTAAPELELRPGDLVLRDRGYLSAEEVKRHREAGADFIYRHKSGNTYLDPETGEPLDLLAKLTKERTIDMVVYMNNHDKTPVRLVAVPVTEEVANVRRMKLKKETRGHAPSKDLLRLMSWTIFITTIPKEEASFEELLDLYGLRWRIETIFKVWKSNLNLDRIHNVSECQLRILIAARMTALVVSASLLFHTAQLRVRQCYGVELSLIKTTKYLVSDLSRMAALAEELAATNGRGPRLNRLVRYCTYEKRERENYNGKWARWRKRFALS